MKRKNIELYAFHALPSYPSPFYLTPSFACNNRGILRRANVGLLEYYLQKKQVKFSEENETLGKLNSFMRKELLIAANSKSFAKSSFFPSLFSPSSMQQIYSTMQEEIYGPKQVIF
jgi:hypothetical protein